MPNRQAHGCIGLTQRTEDEVAWRTTDDVWMSSGTIYKNAGGRVTTGSDSGFIYQTYGFGYINQFEMLQEAGFHPLEVIDRQRFTALRRCLSRRASQFILESFGRGSKPTS